MRFCTASLCDLGKPLSLAVPVPAPNPHVENTTCSSLPLETMTETRQHGLLLSAAVKSPGRAAQNHVSIKKRHF